MLSLLPLRTPCHSLPSCQSCDHCTEQHEIKRCELRMLQDFTPKCTVCRGDHTAWSNAYPARMKELERCNWRNRTVQDTGTSHPRRTLCGIVRATNPTSSLSQTQTRKVTQTRMPYRRSNIYRTKTTWRS